jgi:branched-chain amino acid transport system ATP-binding protein
MTTAPASPLLEIHGLTVRFGGLVAVSEFAMRIEEGQIFTLVGPNGAGKTTVLNCISGFVKPAAGRITFNGTQLLSLGRHRRAALGIGRTFQNLQLFPTMTVVENLLTAQHARLHSGVFQGMLPFGPAKAEDARARNQARATLALLGLEHYADMLVATLPFGVQKLVGVGRALVLRPRLILLDEPAAGLPHQEVTPFAARLRSFRDELGITLLLIEHNMHLVQAVADHVCVLNYGSKLAEGTAKSVLADPAVLEAYLGRDAVSTGEGEGGDHAHS